MKKNLCKLILVSMFLFLLPMTLINGKASCLDGSASHKFTDYKNGLQKCEYCGEMLQESLTIDNTGKKGADSYTLNMKDDFVLSFEFNSKCGNNPSWHNWIFDIVPAQFLNGKLERIEFGTCDFAPVIPYYFNNYYGDEHPYMRDYGKFETTWFKDSNNDFSFDDAMADVNCSAVISRENGIVYIAVRMETLVESATVKNCTINAQIDMSRYKYISVSLTGENNTMILESAKIAEGVMADNTRTELKTENIPEAVTYDNTSLKNVNGYNLTLPNGDFDVEYKFVNNGGESSDWHEFIYNFYSGEKTSNFDSGKIWCFVTNGIEPDGGLMLNSSIGHGFVTRYNSNNFTSMLTNASVDIRLTRVNGKISAMGNAYTNDENKTPICNFNYITKIDFSDEITVRLSGENESLTLNSVSIYKIADNEAAENVIDSIDLIVAVTLNSESAISEARTAYDALTETQKILIENYEKLTAAETVLYQLKEEADKAAADAVAAKISAIGTVTLDSEKAISEARIAYNALTDTQKTLIENDGILTAAENTLNNLKNDKAATNAVIAKISAIGTVTLDSETAINEARTAYDALTDTQKTSVTNYETLKAAKTAFDTLKTANNSDISKVDDTKKSGCNSALESKYALVSLIMIFAGAAVLVKKHKSINN